MDFTLPKFTDFIDEVVVANVEPSLTRILFPVRDEFSSSANIQYNQHAGSTLSGGWNPVGGTNEFDKHTVNVATKNNPVVARTVAVTMDYVAVMRAKEGKTLSLEENVTDLMNNVGLEEDDITINGKHNVKGITHADYYGTTVNTGTATALTKTLATSTPDEIAQVFLNAVTASKKNGKYRGRKSVLLNSGLLNVLRSKRLNDMSVYNYIRTIIPEIADFQEVPNIGNDIIIYERNQAHLYARFTFPLQRLAAVTTDAGGMAAYYAVHYAGLVIRNPEPLVKLTGAA